MKSLAALIFLLTIGLHVRAEEQEGMTVDMHPKLEEEAVANELPVETPKPAPAKKIASKKKAAKKETKPVAAATPAKRDAETSLRFLNNGNSRFVKKNFRSDGRTEADRKRGLEGETPHTVVLASSDSRVVPEIIFDQGLGELYTVRTLGEAVDETVIASLEYAVEKLKVPLLVVLGNSDCAAMKFHSQEDESDLTDSQKELVDAIDPRLKTLKKDEPSPSYEVEATLNADAIAREIIKKSPVIKAAVDSGRLTVKSALYRINTGRVTFY